MDQHPVPQNVTSFEFHLVGEMTLRQFIYLASGLATAYVVFVAFSRDYPFVAWPLIVLFVLTGVAYAFLPIMERPLDHWTAAFFKAIFSPTQYKYASTMINKDSPAFANRLNIYLQQVLPYEDAFAPEPPASTPPKPIPQPAVTAPLPQVPVQVKPVQQAPEPNKITSAAQPVTQMIPLPALPTQPESPFPAVESLPSTEELEKTVSLARKAQDVQNKIVQTEQLLSQIKSSAAVPGVDASQFAERFQKVLTDLQNLNKEASEISSQMANVLKQQTTPVQQQPRVTVKPTIVPTLSLTTTANIVNGIVTDAMGNYLEGAIIVAHDKQGLPVRALKTNKLGQFIAATPLANGTFTITTEKENLVFDDISITLNGTVLNPVVIAAKKAERPTI
jgi:hypothetical protein